MTDHSSLRRFYPFIWTRDPQYRACDPASPAIPSVYRDPQLSDSGANFGCRLCDLTDKQPQQSLADPQSVNVKNMALKKYICHIKECIYRTERRSNLRDHVARHAKRVRHDTTSCDYCIRLEAGRRGSKKRMTKLRTHASLITVSPLKDDPCRKPVTTNIISAIPQLPSTFQERFMQPQLTHGIEQSTTLARLLSSPLQSKSGIHINPQRYSGNTGHWTDAMKVNPQVKDSDESCLSTVASSTRADIDHETKSLAQNRNEENSKEGKVLEIFKVAVQSPPTDSNNRPTVAEFERDAEDTSSRSNHHLLPTERTSVPTSKRITSEKTDNAIKVPDVRDGTDVATVSTNASNRISDDRRPPALIPAALSPILAAVDLTFASTAKQMINQRRYRIIDTPLISTPQPDYQTADQDSSPDERMDVNEADFLPTAQELNPGSVYDFDEQKDAVATPKLDLAPIYFKKRKTNQSKTKVHVIREKRTSAASIEERIPLQKQRVRKFCCKVLGCQLIFEKESDRDHHLQRHLKQRSEERKQYAKRYVKNEMQATTGDDGKHLPAHVKSNCAPVETGVTSEGGHFVSIRLFD